MASMISFKNPSLKIFTGEEENNFFSLVVADTWAIVGRVPHIGFFGLTGYV